MYIRKLMIQNDNADRLLHARRAGKPKADLEFVGEAILMSGCSSLSQHAIRPCSAK